MKDKKKMIKIRKSGKMSKKVKGFLFMKWKNMV